MGKYGTFLGKYGTTSMRKSKKDKLDAATRLFQKKKVLKIDDLFKIFGTHSRRTVHRYMQEIDYLTSYSHAGQYYTLQEIAHFDANGLWHFDDIGFSKHGTLLDTIVHVVNESEGGMTNSELREKFNLLVKAALIDLVKKNKLSREKHTNLYVYLSPDQHKAKNQLKKREEKAAYSVDDATTFRVLLAAYRLVEGAASPEQVAIALKEEGAKVSFEAIQQVFTHYDLGKKTLDSSSFQP
jgi:hypothetical protein